MDNTGSVHRPTERHKAKEVRAQCHPRPASVEVIKLRVKVTRLVFRTLGVCMVIYTSAVATPIVNVTCLVLQTHCFTTVTFALALDVNVTFLALRAQSLGLLIRRNAV